MPPIPTDGPLLIDAFLTYISLELNRSKLTAEAYGRDIRQFADWLTGGHTDGFRPCDAATADIRAWLHALAAAGDTPRTIRRKTQSLRAFYRFLRRRQLVESNPAADIQLAKTDRRLPSFATGKEMEKALAECDSGNDWRLMRDKLIVEILYATGMRRAELVDLTDDTITSGPHPEIKITGKRRKQRIMPIAPDLLAKIEAWQLTRDSLWPDLPAPRHVIAGNNGKVSFGVVDRAVKKVAASVSSPKKSPHMLRHTFATSLINDGADLNSVKELLGHSSLATTQIYTHLSISELRRAYNLAHPRSHTPLPTDDES